MLFQIILIIVKIIIIIIIRKTMDLLSGSAPRNTIGLLLLRKTWLQDLWATSFVGLSNKYHQPQSSTVASSYIKGTDAVLLSSSRSRWFVIWLSLEETEWMSVFRPWVACNQQRTYWLSAVMFRCLRGLCFLTVSFFPSEAKEHHFFPYWPPLSPYRHIFSGYVNPVS